MIEDVVNAIVSALQSGLQTQLTTIQAARESAFALTAPLARSYFTSDVVPTVVQEYPAIFVRSKATTWEDFVGKNKKGSHSLDIVVLHVAADPVALQKLVWRFVEAIEKTLNSSTNRTLQNTVIEMHMVDHNYSPVFPRPEAQMLAGGMVTVEVKERIQTT